MISKSHLNRSFSRFVAFIGILLVSFFEKDLRSKIGSSHQDSVGRQSIIIYRNFLNKQAAASAFIMDSTAATTLFIQNISKFNGTDLVTW